MKYDTGQLESAYLEIIEARDEVEQCKEALAKAKSVLNAREAAFINMRDDLVKEMPELLQGYAEVRGGYDKAPGDDEVIDLGGSIHNRRPSDVVNDM